MFGGPSTRCAGRPAATPAPAPAAACAAPGATCRSPVRARPVRVSWTNGIVPPVSFHSLGARPRLPPGSAGGDPLLRMALWRTRSAGSVTGALPRVSDRSRVFARAAAPYAIASRRRRRVLRRSIAPRSLEQRPAVRSCRLRRRGATVATWLILPVVICLSQRLSHACPSISNHTVKLRKAQ